MCLNNRLPVKVIDKIPMQIHVVEAVASDRFQTPAPANRLIQKLSIVNAMQRQDIHAVQLQIRHRLLPPHAIFTGQFNGVVGYLESFEQGCQVFRQWRSCINMASGVEHDGKRSANSATFPP
ncbi:MAG: hypothetical protein M2R45_03883 [Verrucomicrobia subdivision 3 bacterium]|nr:hypothetical protein [Limisphaerales bacterium]MCS1412587.1 hypothetical protein [Limisphaerales bacterium]